MSNNNHYGCLLIHGFGGIPQEMGPLGKFLERNGYAVQLVQLAGHGQDSSRAGSVSWQDWLTSVRDGYQLLSEQADRIFFLGHSTGGLLALMAAGELPSAGVVGFAPICMFNRAQKAVIKLSRFVKKYPPVPGYYSPDGEGLRIKFYRPYGRSLQELNKLVEIVPECLKNVRIPILVFYGGRDLSVSPASGERLAALLPNTTLQRVVDARLSHQLMFPLEDNRIWLKTLNFLNTLKSLDT
jgi:carboxylesterase